MSDERFDRVDSQLDHVVGRLDHVDRRLDRVDGRLGRIDARLDVVETDVKTLVSGQKGLETSVEELRAGQLLLQNGQASLERYMRVLHEDAMDTLKALTMPVEPLRREMRAADDAVREDIGRRIDPIELAVRNHSSDLAQLKRRRKV